MEDSNSLLGGILFLVAIFVLGMIVNWWEQRSQNTKTIILVIIGFGCPIIMFATFTYSEMVVDDPSVPEWVKQLRSEV